MSESGGVVSTCHAAAHFDFLERARTKVSTLTTDRNRTRKTDAVLSVSPRSWDDFGRLFPIYEALTRQLDLGSGPYPLGIQSGSWSDKNIRDRDLHWLDQVDRHVQAVHLRHMLVTPAVAREDSLRLFLQRHLCKPEKLPADRDKIDLLLVQYFVLCAPQDLIAGPIEFSDVAKILQPVLGELEPESSEGCEPLDRILEAAKQCRSLRDLMEKGILEQGKLVKAAVVEKFNDSAALVSICRFNFLFRRAFIHWLHADLRAIGTALNQLEKRNCAVIDCRRAGFSSKEPVSTLRQFHQHWKPPFQTDYSQGSAFKAYDQLMCLREDLEDALSQAGASNGSAPNAARINESGGAHRASATSPSNGQPLKEGPSAAASNVSAPPPLSGKPQDLAGSASPSNSSALNAAQSQDETVSSIGAVDVGNLEEQIWEQLIATPPVRGRSMTTVTLDNARILLSAWEVAAFISESGQDSEELRRLIVARVFLSSSIERKKRLADFKALQQAIAHARAEIPRFQERVDQLKRTMKTDGAVNLGISLKRLLSLVEEAEQLQKGNDPKQEKR
jgi:hypothetical protein